MEKCIHVGIVDAPQSLDALYAKLWDCSPDTGTVAAYVGRVKGPGRRLELSIVDEKLAVEELRGIVESVAQRHPGLRGALLYTHRGILPPGHPVVYILVAAVDRRTAIEALAELVDAYKATRFIIHRDIVEARG